MNNKLDTEYIWAQVQDALQVANWAYIQQVYITGSFANTNKDIDTDGRSDIDVELITTDFKRWFEAQGDTPCYDGANPVKIHITSDNGTVDYGERVMDLCHGTTVDTTVDRITLYERS